MIGPNSDKFSELTTCSCPHILELDQESLVQTQEHFEEQITSTDLECEVCLETMPKENINSQNLWMCLQPECLQVTCSDTIPSHSLQHYKNHTKHAVHLNINSLRVWCHECEVDIIISDEEPYDYHNRKPQRPRGLTGLQNLGNTCYMNSALQALANTPPLVNYILARTFADEDRGNRSRMLITSFHNLITEMWSPKRHLYIPPPHILYAIRATHPMFRGFQQHDSQEFLRCLMDQLHEEMKTPCPEPLQPQLTYDNESDDEGNSSEGEEYETCDSGVSERSSLSEDTNQLKPMSLSRSPSPEENAKRKTSQGNQTGTPAKSKKTFYQSIISDIFDGNLLSSVQCLTCNRVSTRVETFQDLSLPIPNRDHLNILHQNNVPGPPKCTHLYSREQGWYSWLWDWFCSWFWGPTISLHDCLSAFFSADELKGDNMYSCDKCNKLRNGIKFSKVLKTPEVLCIHLKRFRHDLVFSSKIAGYIKFPLEGLDIKPYVHEDCQGGITKYNLISVICHHGASGSGGHYTCYALNRDTNQWYHYDDSSVTRVSKQTVNSSQAYVLFYLKDPVKSYRWRKRFHHLEQATASEPKTHLISSHWVNKFLTFSEPGPIDNRELVEGPNWVPTDDENSCERISASVWNYLVTTFKGGPPVSVESYLSSMNQRLGFTGPTYAVPVSWLNQWEAFKKGQVSEPPGPIDTSTVANGPICELTQTQWDVLVGVYGGGPPVILRNGTSQHSSLEPTYSLERADSGLLLSSDTSTPQPCINEECTNA
ncbi:hypothetical protein GE061_017876 [Apolygus lucorum]|uniref:Ubiquitin carboxyl-terminal hydrolase n=1 Tax=Apolygus lucorum TaxID=248454 RepID=A0A6A4JFE8_APOLU|nr:hypothetical protein GE061_017876 [Apolygus lucorum]